MSRRYFLKVVWTLALALPVLGQMPPEEAPKPVFIQSFRQGHTRVSGESVEINLDPANPTCKVRVKESSGLNRYQLTCIPQRVGPEDPKIFGWHIWLADMHHKIYDNILSSSPNPAENKVQIDWLDPGRFPKIPLKALRIIKVDDFYCVIQVLDVHFGHPPDPYPDRLVLSVKFTNADPRVANAAAMQ